MLSSVKPFVGRVAAAVFLADFIHVYTYLNRYYENDQDQPYIETEQDKLLIAPYLDGSAEENLVTDEEFEQCVQEVLNEIKEEGLKGGLHPLGHVVYKINRESVNFLGGGRATWLQLAHPYVAAGIRDHSMLEYGVARRFYNTFKYMFGMTFGTPEDVVASARAVHNLHVKVKGQIKEDVGVFSSSSRFSALEKNAIRYVGATLLETAIFEYELHVGMLTDAEKDELIQSGSKLIRLFGVRHTGNEPKTYKDFRRMMSLLFRSKLLTVSETARDTAEFLMLPPSPLYIPAMSYFKWSIGVSLPPRFGKQYMGREITFIDRLAFALLHAVFRFFYRLMPGSFRYLTAYWRLYDNARPGERSALSKFLTQTAANMANRLIVKAMPDRNPEESRRIVKQKREQRLAAQAQTLSA